MKSALYETNRSFSSHFEKVLLTNSIDSYWNLLKNFIFFHFLLLEVYEEGALRKEPVIELL